MDARPKMRRPARLSTAPEEAVVATSAFVAPPALPPPRLRPSAPPLAYGNSRFAAQ
jgi:hypothetical protein